MPQTNRLDDRFPRVGHPHRPWTIRLWRTSAVVLLLLAAISAGCESKSFLNPGELVDPKEGNKLRSNGTARPRVQTILTELDLGVDPVARSFPDARDVAARDLEVNAQDYRLGPADLVQVTIGGLLPNQQPFTGVLRVSDTGLLNLPDLQAEFRQVRVAGMTEVEAGAEIARTYVDAGVFVVEPPVTLLVVEPNSKVFKVAGNVARPARYVLVRVDYRLLDAITESGGAADPDVSGEYAYIIRSRAAAGVDGPAGGQRPGDPLDPRNPRSLRDGGNSEWPLEELRRAAAPEVPVFAAGQGGQPAGQGRDDAFQFQPPQPPADVEVIRIPLRELLRGRLQYNVVIRPDDTIIIPPPPTGEYYVGGHVMAPGAFMILPGRQLTMKQAIVTARMLDEVAIPGRTQLIRRIGDQDVFVRVDLSKVFVGEEPDIYLQPNDMILVGTNAVAPFLAAFRNGFRVTYGFGFIYDRNFAYSGDDRPFF